MNPAPRKGLRMLEFILTFAVLFFITNAALNFFFPSKEDQPRVVTLSMEKEKIAIGNAPVVIIENTTDQDLQLPPRCPTPPVDIFYQERSTDEIAELIPNESEGECEDLLLVPAGEKVKIDLTPWKSALFSQTGEFTASVDLGPDFVIEDGQTAVSADFRITDPGFFTKIFRTFVTKPLYNALVFIASWLPNQSLGWAIIILTLIIKLILLIPNQHALEGQMKLQAVQPKMDDLKKKYKDDPKKLQEETMKLWKEMKVNPLQSCMPMLLQLPILIGLFFVIKDGITLGATRHLLYSMYIDLPSNFLDPTFLGLNLEDVHVWLFPPLLVILQFIQMKMMMKKKRQQEIEVKPTVASRLQSVDQQTIMLWVLPFMIGFFALQFPSAVSLYWGASTVFGIAQQWWIMRKRVANSE